MHSGFQPFGLPTHHLTHNCAVRLGKFVWAFRLRVAPDRVGTFKLSE